MVSCIGCSCGWFFLGVTLPDKSAKSGRTLAGSVESGNTSTVTFCCQSREAAVVTRMTQRTPNRHIEDTGKTHIPWMAPRNHPVMLSEAETSPCYCLRAPQSKRVRDGWRLPQGGFGMRCPFRAEGHFSTMTQGSFATLGWRIKPTLGLKLAPFGSGPFASPRATGLLDPVV
jgi:hypothetical protein